MTDDQKRALFKATIAERLLSCQHGVQRTSRKPCSRKAVALWNGIAVCMAHGKKHRADYDFEFIPSLAEGRVQLYPFKEMR